MSAPFPIPPQTGIKLRRHKVKTGCRTCKIRKIKCDEGRPACRRCLSTGRACDGYGIWGGGGNRYEQRTTRATAVSCSTPPAITSTTPSKLQIQKTFAASLISTATPEEQSCFDFFRDRTSRRLCAVFGSSIWNAIVFQASANEPVVLHAVLALGSAHRRKEHDGVGRDRSLVLPDRQERFMLWHYTKAIECLKPHALPSGEVSVRTALIACLLFYCIEMMRGNYATSRMHLDSGTRLAVNTSQSTIVNGKSVVPRTELVDDSLMQTLTRLQVHCALAAHYSQRLDSPTQSLCNALPASKFQSVGEAWSCIDQVIEGIDHMKNEYHRTPDPESWPASYRDTLNRDRCFTLAALHTWLRTYDATIKDASSRSKHYEVFSFQLLRPYHTMATIKAATCLSLDNQLIFDDHASRFAAVVAQSKEIMDAADRLRIKSSLAPTDQLDSRAGRVNTDSGWVAPLYYTALKCRDHRLRTEAAKLLSSRWHMYSETFFNSDIAVAVVEEVIRIEGSSACAERVDYQPERDISVTGKIDVSRVPVESRIQETEVDFSENESGSFRLLCKRRNQGEWYVIATELHSSKRVWKRALIDHPTFEVP
ncbi:hypothetical protein K458DRAFT_392491 [Lentithecium fluviatile CBS 122367]|uniref:Zn(2)-C6 fungal-type domain-containing protein n=1 Tax=Lentithecium fluviatile CBS 122367 TaxID=1168545 RepID=A0A6G1IRU1_9PLEO|nr:hypothetical protein K458DRAFT_392491 [Lentithecium fluviatile CBS 122367]